MILSIRFVLYRIRVKCNIWRENFNFTFNDIIWKKEDCKLLLFYNFELKMFVYINANQLR